jgi:hypothetical protein
LAAISTYVIIIMLPIKPSYVNASWQLLELAAKSAG